MVQILNHVTKKFVRWNKKYNKEYKKTLKFLMQRIIVATAKVRKLRSALVVRRKAKKTTDPDVYAGKQEIVSWSISRFTCNFRCGKENVETFKYKNYCQRHRQTCN